MVKNLITVLDGQTGSCGKGKVLGEIANKYKICAAITTCSPNAGHSYVDKTEKKYVFRNIPVSVVNQNADIFISAGSSIDMDVFKKEYDSIEKLLGDRKIYVHELVPLIEDRHKEFEKIHIKSGSTYEGCGAVQAEKILRNQNLQFFKGYKNAIAISNQEYLDRVHEHLSNLNAYVILEGSQGAVLGLNYSNNYPFVTRKDISVEDFLAETGISHEHHLGNLLVIRPFPIRISNVTKDGNVVYTGSIGNGVPLKWTQVNIASAHASYPFYDDLIEYQYPYDLKEKYVKHLLTKSTEITLKQLFGGNFRNKSLNDITLLEALELERLFYKNQGIKVYESEIIKEFDGCPMFINDLSEQTTVTKMERRIGDIDIKSLQNVLDINPSYGIYLNFFEQLDYTYSGKKGNIYPSFQLERYLEWLEGELNTPIIRLGTGPKNGECILTKSLLPRIKK